MKVEQTMKVLAVVAVVLICWASTVEPQVPQITTVTFDVRGATKVTYDKFMEDLRKAMTVRGSELQGIPVLPSTSVLGPKDRTRYVVVKLMGYKYYVELAIDVTDVYVLGYRPGDEKTSYFFQDVTKDVQNLLFQGTTTRTGLSFTGNYISLERKANTHRDQIPLGYEQLRKKVEVLIPEDHSSRR
ncbi:hypothetical protein HRI_004136900 [Hibiscus trionum]|uniref:rRNA N-glycosylase n=1 Tax=Hibiscus trionum TaxID=183268 RepID=A0A9W7ML95_HIBTR|nr:hypothetical protein HRI_004136900 [Hibiscus trionum]